ncbi:MAG: hypothetical protein AMXMBFR13_36420 [Phycisphaerae bacterium]
MARIFKALYPKMKTMKSPDGKPLRDEKGKPVRRPVMKPAKNEDGRPILDENAQPVMKAVYLETRKWYIEYTHYSGPRDPGRIKRVAGFTDKKSTETKAGELEREAERIKSGYSDPHKEHWQRPIGDHLDDWNAALLAKGNTIAHAAKVTSRARKIITACSFEHWPEISGSRVMQRLAEMQKADKEGRPGISIQTKNHYLQALKQFCRWMMSDRRAPENPLAFLHGGNPRLDRRHVRRALSAEELRELLATTETGPERAGMSGPDRSMLYRLAVETGLRRDELGSLRPESFNLEATPPTITVAAAYSKHRREDIQPIRVELAAMLQEWLKGRPADQPVFNVPRKTSEMLRQDLEAARALWLSRANTPQDAQSRARSDFLEREDAAGRVVDFHGLRHTFITSLVRANVSPKTAQALARHGTITLTMDRYTHLAVEDAMTGLSALPDLPAPAGQPRPEPQELRATGTDGAPPEAPEKSLPSSLPELRRFAAISRGTPDTLRGNDRPPDELPGNRRKARKKRALAISCAPQKALDTALPKEGLEPSSPYGDGFLKPARMPIPPLRRRGDDIIAFPFVPVPRERLPRRSDQP